MNNTKITERVILLSVLLIAFCFYWYEVREVQIKKNCIESAVQETKEKNGDQSDVRYRFWKCSNQHGL